MADFKPWWAELIPGAIKAIKYLIDNPIKIIFAFGLSMAAIVVISSYEKRDSIRWPVSNGEGKVVILEIDLDALEPEIKKLVDKTGAETVIVYRVKVLQDKRIPILVYSRKHGRVPSLEGGAGEELLSAKYADINFSVKDLIDGKAVCRAHTAISEEGRYIASLGVTNGCAVPIPPKYDEFIGIMTVGFKSKVSDERDIKNKMFETSAKIVKEMRAVI